MKVRAPQGSVRGRWRMVAPRRSSSANRGLTSSTVIEADGTSPSRSLKPGAKTGSLHPAQVQPGAVAHHLSVEGGLAIGEPDLEAELPDEIVARRFNVGDEQLGLGGDQGGLCRRSVLGRSAWP